MPIGKGYPNTKVGRAAKKAVTGFAESLGKKIGLKRQALSEIGKSAPRAVKKKKK